FSPTHLPRNCDLVIYTGAHGGLDNPQVQAALKLKIPVMSHAQALALFSEGKKILATAGVGGKSSTAAMLASVLTSAGYPTSFAVGVGNIPCLNAPGRMRKNDQYFVVEADEYVTDPLHNLIPRFHYLTPYLVIITNLEHDHPDVYKNIEQIFDSFKTFVKPIPASGAVIANFDNPHLKKWLKTIDKPIITYGFSPQADWRVLKTHVADQKQFISLQYQGIIWPDLVLSLPGDYNALNALAAVAAGHHLGLSQPKIYHGLTKFTGTKRRFELIMAIKNIALYDDYAHHPTEITALLKAAKSWLPNRRLIIIFQSHTYSRTKSLLKEFCRSFNQADILLVNDIFASAREIDNLGLTSKSFTQSIQQFHPRTVYCPDKSATLVYLKNTITRGDVIFTVGAGDNWLWHKEIIKIMKQA
ncbi:MAG: Mur ligase family protein, partial [Patescibacteria group bacterium]|nr:Mur ligase family protein [Patescibacteria group bacterium]